MISARMIKIIGVSDPWWQAWLDPDVLGKNMKYSKKFQTEILSGFTTVQNNQRLRMAGIRAYRLNTQNRKTLWLKKKLAWGHVSE